MSLLFQDITKSNKNLLPLLFPRYWLHFPENHQNRSPTFPEKFRKIVFPFSVLIQNLSSENDLNFQGNWTPFSVNVIFFFVWTANEFTRVLIKSEANPPPPSDGSHEYSRSFKTARHSWENLTPQQVSPKKNLFYYFSVLKMEGWGLGGIGVSVFRKNWIFSKPNIGDLSFF